MNDRPHLARLAADALAAEPLPSYAPDPRAEDLIVQAMAARIERDAKRRAARRVALSLAVAATFALAGTAALLARHRGGAVVALAPPAPVVAPAVPPSASAPAGPRTYVDGDHASVTHLGAELALNGDVVLAEGDRVVASLVGQAAIHLPSGTRVAVEPGAQVSVVKQGLIQMFALDVGSLRADVTPLAEGGQFVVRTPDIEVEAGGTAFRVTTGQAVACGGHATRVDVESGSVVVRSGGKEERVAAGGRWPTACESAAAESVPVTRAGGGHPHGRSARPKHPSAQAETSELKAQTLLYGDALSAKKSGDVQTAIARFDQYVALYPESALAEGAAVNRMELLEGTDHARAATAARAYLQRYPDGHARAEAARIAGGP
jgi:hypothetical protein